MRRRFYVGADESALSALGAGRVEAVNHPLGRVGRWLHVDQSVFISFSPAQADWLALTRNWPGRRGLEAEVT
ncbi:hypothetical protein T03_7088 [Trichinella britovi]|uniref:Uncharacterized protein n=1 Tax=Trichinella britovi TaxID=45882 RepID=A0A0V1CF33_TRIBR|nr:hypothetical protein T06_6836 [Trichinella sp. T6]KRY47840.1 hypothetical protein T03_7088 [Trichinella britovi]